MIRIIFSLCLLCALAGTATASSLNITTESGSERELQVANMIQKFEAEFDLSEWRFTNNIHIKSRAIPHSHPVLTLHTRHIKKPYALYSTYLHEQIHWYLDAHPAKETAAKADLALLLGEAKTGRPYGSRTVDATYMHVIVCFLEIDAMKKLFGTQKANELLNFWRNDHYTWVYDQLTDHWDEIEQIIIRHDLKI
ncbi:MAG: hypothetical protein HWE08_07350 [Alphaproteobacteria bacterium]|nr:hypothetical protein [Alphaproteobacteria bacterium]